MMASVLPFASLRRECLYLQKICVSVFNQVRLLDAEFIHQILRFDHTVVWVFAFLEHNFQFDKVAEILDGINVNTGSTNQVAFSNFLHGYIFTASGRQNGAEGRRLICHADHVDGSFGSSLICPVVENEFAVSRRKNAELQTPDSRSKKHVGLRNYLRWLRR